MSKIAEALKRANEERSHIVSPTREKYKLSNNLKMGGTMRKSWVTWGIVVVIVTVFVVFNYQEGRDAVPLSEIFPDEEVYPVDVEYEFVQEEVVSSVPEPAEETVVAQQVPATEETQTPALTAVGPEPAKEHTAYTIQIASFKDQKRAQNALTAIREKVPSAYIASRDLGAKGMWYRIYAGRFDVRKEAEVSLNDIKKNYDSSFIISPK